MWCVAVDSQPLFRNCYGPAMWPLEEHYANPLLLYLLVPDSMRAIWVLFEGLEGMRMASALAKVKVLLRILGHSSSRQLLLFKWASYDSDLYYIPFAPS